MVMFFITASNAPRQIGNGLDDFITVACPDDVFRTFVYVLGFRQDGVTERGYFINGKPDHVPLFVIMPCAGLLVLQECAVQPGSTTDRPRDSRPPPR